MKFEEDLQRFSIPEWRTRYVNYKFLKQKLDRLEERYPRNKKKDKKDGPKKEKKRRFTIKIGPSSAEDEADVTHPLVPVIESLEEKVFQEELEKELEKVNDFFIEKEQEVIAKFGTLTSQIEAMNQQKKLEEEEEKTRHGFGWILHFFRNSFGAESKKVELLKLAFQEFYRSLDLLKSFRLMNQTGFRKIVKKHDKITGLVTLEEFMRHVDQMHFVSSHLVESLIRDTEKAYTEHLEHGNSRNAMRSLRVPPEGFQPIDWITMTNGMLVGIVFACLVAIALGLVFGGVSNRVHSEALFQMLRGTFLFIFFACLISVNVYVWKLFGVNYVFIFDLNARYHASYKEILQLAAIPLLLWSIGTLAYSYSKFTVILPVRYTPLIILIVVFTYFLLPFRFVRLAKGRLWFMGVLSRIVSSPLYPVRFVDIFIADQFNSLVTALLDIEFLICYYSFDVNKELKVDFVCSSVGNGVRAVVACLPAWWRFAQCLRRYHDTGHKYNLVNAGKYASVFFVVLFSSLASEDKVKRGTASVTVYLYFWIFFALVNTLYSAAWDLLMDWSLLDKDAPHKFLRQKLIYPPWMYYCAIVFNVLCRLLWTLNISVGFFNLVASPPLGAALAIAEVLRRFVWNFIRLENEHVNNCEKFRVVKEIPLPYEYMTTDELNFAADEDGFNAQLSNSRPQTPILPTVSKSRSTIIQMNEPISENDIFLPGVPNDHFL